MGLRCFDGYICMEFPLDLVWFKLPWLGLQESFFFFFVFSRMASHVYIVSLVKSPIRRVIQSRHPEPAKSASLLLDGINGFIVS